MSEDVILTGKWESRNEMPGIYDLNGTLIDPSL
jgi:hypothetical protein